MKVRRPWVVGVVLSVACLAPWGAHAQTASPHAVVVLASAALPESERAVLAGLLDRLNRNLDADDRLGVILYSDIVEHVSELAPPSAETAQRINRVFSTLPANEALNGAVGVDRALELLSETSLPRSVIVIGELKIRLQNEILQGRYARWLEGTLLPTAALEGIGLMAVAPEASHQGIRQRHGETTFAQLAASELDPDALATLALQHVRNRSISTLAASTPASTHTPSATTRSSPPSSTPTATDTPLTRVAPSTLLDESATADSLAKVDGPVVADTSAMAPLLALGATLVALFGAGLYYWSERTRRRGLKRSPVLDTAEGPAQHQEASFMQTLARTLPAATVVAGSTVQTSRSNRDDGESRFDALIDSISGADSETLPVQSRHSHDLDDLTVDTRTVDSRRKGSTSTADLTRELEDLTRERSTQYDFE